MSKPWNCPKGYGLCWECILPCDTPSSSNSESNLGKLLHRAIDEGFVDRHKEKLGREQRSEWPFPGEASHWRERALKAEARLAELEAPQSASAPLTANELAHLFEVIEDSGVKLEDGLWDKLTGMMRAADKSAADKEK